MKYIFTIFAAFVLCTSAIAQQVGSKVSLTGTDGRTYTGIVTDIHGGKYKVKYDGYNFDAWLTSNQFTVVNDNASLPTQNQAANKYKPGDRVESDKAGTSYWEPGTIMPFLNTDTKDGSYYRVRTDVHARDGMYLEGLTVPVNRIRLSHSPAYQKEKTTVSIGKVTVDADNTLSADRPILQCPVQQTPVSKNAKPNVELFKKIIRCLKGERAASKGVDGFSNNFIYAAFTTSL